MLIKLSTWSCIESVMTDNSTFERVEEFRYLGTTLTHPNSIPEEIKSRLRPGNACYIRSIIFCHKWYVLLTQYCAGDKIEKSEMGWACGAYG